MRRSALKRAPPAARLGEHVPFVSHTVAEAPASPGVYLLYRGHYLAVYLDATGGLLPDCNDYQRSS